MPSAHVPHRTLSGVLALIMGLALLGVGLTTADAQETPEPVVESARQVSADPRPARLYPIPSIEVDPTDPDTLVVGAAEARFGGCRLYTSRDGGLTWLETAQNMLVEPYDLCIRRPFGPIVEPVFTPDGERLYVGFGGADKDGTEYPNGPTAALFASTEDLGLTVETTVVRESGELEAPEGDTVREQHEMATVAVDPTDHDRVYRGWRRQSTSSEAMIEDRPGFPRGVDSVDGLHTMIAVSEDGGASWGDPIDLTREFGGDEMTEGGTDLATVVTGPDGTAHVFTKERRSDDDPDRIIQWRSEDDGASWELSAIDVGQGGLTTPDAVIDQETGDIHVAYEVSRALPDGGEDDPSPTRVEFVTSSDGGDTWTDPVDVVDGDAVEGANQYFPGIDVAPNGRIDVTWWDFRDDPFWSPGEEGGHDAGERYANIYYSYSTDGGRTWSRDIRVNDRLIDTSYGVAFPGATRGPVSVASTDDAAYATWPDTRAATEVNAVADVYMTRIRMQPELVSASAGGAGDAGVVGIGLGAGIALAVGGLVLMLAVRQRRRLVTDADTATSKSSKSSKSSDEDATS